jgi:hypothetical protein
MLNFTREERGMAYDKLPKDLKRVVMSGALAQTFQKIGTEHRLPVDKMGALADLVTLTILDLVSRDSLQAKISEELRVSGNDAALIARSVNDQVFLRIQEILKQEQERELNEEPEPTEPEALVEETETPPAREDLLAQIEDPQSIAASSRELHQETHDFIGDRLTTSTSVAPQKTTVEVKKLPEKAKDYSNDPYREPIL